MGKFLTDSAGARIGPGWRTCTREFKRVVLQNQRAGLSPTSVLVSQYGHSSEIDGLTV